ncbi:MAG TPA: TraB/GumN family protein, partial [Chthoniobacterales bacterium]|nr:TraB/GumN family protein [Chthoniobacterales bacterium]
MKLIVNLQMNRSIILLVALCAMLFSLRAADAAPGRKQFLWRVMNAPAPFYIVGSMHALREEDYPTDLNEFNLAIGQSQQFIFERDPRANDPLDLWRKLTAQGAYPRGVTIQQRVSPSTFALLKRIARIPQSAYERQKPWAIAALNLKAQGMDTVRSEWSMDHYIYQKARRVGQSSGL